MVVWQSETLVDWVLDDMLGIKMADMKYNPVILVKG